MGMIHDEELRQMFQIECEEHLQKLEEGLLYLEQHPDDGTILDELQRGLHNLKGAARMLGIEEIEQLSHCMETIFKSIFRNEIALTAARVDHLELGLDALRKMANEALTGTTADINTAELLAKLAITDIKDIKDNTDKADNKDNNYDITNAPTAVATATTDTANTTEIATVGPTPGLDIDITAKQKAQEPDAQPIHIQAKVLNIPEAEKNSYKIETIRVEPKKLDILMTRSGELMVTKTHVDRWLNKVEDLILLWEDASQNIKKALKHDIISDQIESMGDILYPLRQAAFEDSAALSRITEGLESDIRVLRLLPIDKVFQLFPRMVRDLARALSKDVELVIQGGDTTADKQIIETLKDPLMHLIRNAIHHGIEPPEQRIKLGKSAHAIVKLRAYRTAAHIIVEISDDGKGLDIDAIRKKAMDCKLLNSTEVATISTQRLYTLIFSPGFSTCNSITDISGRGIGLDVVKTNVERLKGNITVESVANKGCKFIIKLPLTLATTRVFLVTIAAHRYAVPVEFVRLVKYVTLNEIFLVQDQETISIHGEAVSMVWMQDLLEIANNKEKLQPNTPQKQPCLLLEINEEQLGIFVDEIVEELEIVLKPTGPLLNRVRNVSGVTILGSGEVCVVLNPFDLIRTAQKQARGKSHLGTAYTPSLLSTSTDKKTNQDKKPLILLAEDSITTRTQEKRILETAGYDVITAVDGLAAFNILTTRQFDAIVSDVEMPQMDGLTLASKVRENKVYEHLPIVLVTSLATEEDRKRGLDVGADAYIVKSSFNQQNLLDTLNRLI